jgi:hypothetical protein
VAARRLFHSVRFRVQRSVGILTISRTTSFFPNHPFFI